MNKELTETQKICLSCMECCKGMLFHTAYEENSPGAREFFEARGCRVTTYNDTYLAVDVKIRCPHLDDQKGCLIYETRPQVCRDYYPEPDDPFITELCLLLKKV